LYTYFSYLASVSFVWCVIDSMSFCQHWFGHITAVSPLTSVPGCIGTSCLTPQETECFLPWANICVYWYMYYFFQNFKHGKNSKNCLFWMYVTSCCNACFCVVRYVCLCTDHLVMVTLNLTCLHCCNILSLNMSSIYKIELLRPSCVQSAKIKQSKRL